MPTGCDVTPRPAVLIDAKAVGVMLGVTEATVRKYDREGMLPRSVEVGGERKWHRKEIKHWIGQGCPSREAWEASPSSTCVPQLKKTD